MALRDEKRGGTPWKGERPSGRKAAGGDGGGGEELVEGRYFKTSFG